MPFPDHTGANPLPSSGQISSHGRRRNNHQVSANQACHSREFWPHYRGRTMHMLAQKYQPHRAHCNVTKLPSTYKPEPGDLVRIPRTTSQRPARKTQATAPYTADPLLRQFEDFFEDRYGEEAGGEGYRKPLVVELHKKLHGYFGPPQPSVETLGNRRNLRKPLKPWSLDATRRGGPGQQTAHRCRPLRVASSRRRR